MAGQPGEVVLASDYATAWARKTADESVTSSSTLQADDELAVELAGDSVYEFEALLLCTGSAAGDIKVAWALPSGARIYWAGLGGSESDGGYGVAGATRHSASLGEDEAAYAFTGSTSPLAVRARGIVMTAAASGMLQLKWAQNTSSATAAVVKEGSFLRAVRREIGHEPFPGTTPAPTPTPTPTPTGRTRMLWHFPVDWGGPDPAAWPTDIAPALTVVSCGVAQSAASGTGSLTSPDFTGASALLSRGIKVYGQIGGSSDGGITVTNTTQADQFIASVTSWGGNIGADCDLEPSGSNWTHAAIVAALRGCSQATGVPSIVTSGIYDDGAGHDWGAMWGAVCQELGSDLKCWVSMLYDFPEAGDSRLNDVILDKLAIMREYVPDSKIVMAFAPRVDGYPNASPPGVIPAAFATAIAVAPTIGWALWEDKNSAATSWVDLRALASM